MIHMILMMNVDDVSKTNSTHSTVSNHLPSIQIIYLH